MQLIRPKCAYRFVMVKDLCRATSPMSSNFAPSSQLSREQCADRGRGKFVMPPVTGLPSNAPVSSGSPVFRAKMRPVFLRIVTVLRAAIAPVLSGMCQRFPRSYWWECPASGHSSLPFPKSGRTACHRRPVQAASSNSASARIIRLDNGTHLFLGLRS